MLKNKKEIGKLSLILILFSIVSMLYVWVPHMQNDFFQKKHNVMYLTMSLVGGLAGIGSYLLQILLSNKKADSSTMGLGAMNIIGLLIGMSMFGTTAITAAKGTNVMMAITFIASFAGVLLIWLMAKYLFKNSNYILVVGLVITLVATVIGYQKIERTNINIIAEINPYLVGSLALGRNGHFCDNHIVAIIVLSLSLLYLLAFGDKVVMAAADEDKAKSLGIKINLHKFISLLLIAATSASSFLLAGNIMFIGFAVGNLNYMLFKTRMRFSAISVVFLGATIAVFSFWLFYVQLKLHIEGSFGISCIIGSGIVLFVSIAGEEAFKWIKTLR